MRETPLEEKPSRHLEELLVNLTDYNWKESLICFQHCLVSRTFYITKNLKSIIFPSASSRSHVPAGMNAWCSAVNVGLR